MGLGEAQGGGIVGAISDAELVREGEVFACGALKGKFFGGDGLGEVGDDVSLQQDAVLITPYEKPPGGAGRLQRHSPVLVLGEAWSGRRVVAPAMLLANSVVVPTGWLSRCTVPAL